MTGTLERLDLSIETPARKRLKEIASQPDGAMELASGALWIAIEDLEKEAPSDPGAYLTRLDALADRVRRAVHPGADAPARLVALKQVLFEEEGFVGHKTNYYHRDNVLLPRVMDSLHGLPILLAVIYIEVARRAGIDASPVAFPGHFLVRCETADGMLIVDPFHRGRYLDRVACESLFGAMTGHRLEFDQSVLEPTSTRHTLSRILVNLRQMYLRDEDYGRALRVQDRLVLLNARAPDILYDRSRLLTRLGAWRGAAADMETVLVLDPDGPRTHELQRELAALRREAEHLN